MVRISHCTPYSPAHLLESKRNKNLDTVVFIQKTNRKFRPGYIESKFRFASIQSSIAQTLKLSPHKCF